MESNRIQPRITVLSEEHLGRVHDYALQILASVGVRVDSERARRVFASGVGAAAIDGDRVCFPAELVEWAIEQAPPTIDVYDRRGNPVFCLGNDRTRFGIGVTTLYYQDPVTDVAVPFARKHMERMVRLGMAVVRRSAALWHASSSARGK